MFLRWRRKAGCTKNDWHKSLLGTFIKRNWIAANRSSTGESILVKTEWLPEIESRRTPITDHRWQQEISKKEIGTSDLSGNRRERIFAEAGSIRSRSISIPWIKSRSVSTCFRLPKIRSRNYDRQQLFSRYSIATTRIFFFSHVISNKRLKSRLCRSCNK